MSLIICVLCCLQMYSIRQQFCEGGVEKNTLTWRIIRTLVCRVRKVAIPLETLPSPKRSSMKLLFEKCLIVVLSSMKLLFEKCLIVLLLSDFCMLVHFLSVLVFLT